MILKRLHGWMPDFGLDLRSLAVLRIGMALLLLGDLAWRLPNFTAFYTDEGALPRTVLLSRPESAALYSLHSLGGSAVYEAFLFAGAALIALALLAGWKTRLATLFSWILLISLHNRNPDVIHGGDTLIRLVLLWGMFLPWGERFSLDSRGRSRGSNRIVSMGTIALTAQISMLYWFSIVHKLRGSVWREGLAVYYTMNLDMYVRGGAKFIAHFPALMAALTYSVIVVEFAAPLLVVWPKRTALCRITAIALIWLLHAGMGSCLCLGTFSWIGAVSMLGFIPSECWDRLGWGRSGASGRPAEKIPAWFQAAGGAVAVVFLTYAFTANTETIPRLHVKIPARIHKIFAPAYLRQNWCMFAPSPPRKDGWIVVEGDLEDGSSADLLWPDGRIRLTKPDRSLAETLGFRWHEFILRSVIYKKGSYRGTLGDYLVKKWDAGHGPDKKVRGVKLIFMEEKTPPPGKAAVLKKHILYEKTY